MFKITGCLVGCIFVLAAINLTFSIYAEGFPYGDACMDFIIVLAIFLNFRQWSKNVMIYLDKRFLQPLRHITHKDRHIFETRLETLAASILTRCDDEDAAVVLVKEGRLIKERSFANRVSILLSKTESAKISKLTQEDEEHFKRHLFRYLLYRIGEINMGFCCCFCCCNYSFKKKGVNRAMQFTRRLNCI